MVKGNDPFWLYIEEINNGNSLKCTFCGSIFSGGTSISRIKYHLARVEGRGVKICTQVTADVQQAASDQISNKKHKSMPSSSNNELVNAESTPVTVLGTEQEEQPLLDDGLWMGSLIGGEIELIEEPRAPGVLMPDAPETRMRTEQPHQADKEFERNPFNKAVELMMQSFERGRSIHKRRRTRRNVLPTRRYVLPTTKLVGQVFERNMKDVWFWLLNDEVSCIGIYGMGGVGKTTLAMHIHNQILERPDIFHHVCWITVSQEFSIYTLQNLIAEAFQLVLSNRKDVKIRAGELLTELSVKRKYVLILDDLWNHFHLVQVGIPLRMDGCKLILTTRSLDICHQMDCQRKIRVEPLSEVEAWNLFMEKLGHNFPLSPEVKQIAESVVKECAGLPLGITTMAGSMKGLDDLSEWRNALRELERSEVGPSEMEIEVFRKLKFSYARLHDSALKECFLYCALFPEDKKIRREGLIEYLIDEGIIEEMESRHAQFDKGQTMLNRLENASLLEGSWDNDYRYVKMHDLVRDMAVRIMKENSSAMVQAGAQLTELPHENWWREDLLRVSLMENRIMDTSGCSPSCPSLSTLLLCRNYKLKWFQGSFFWQFSRLEVLDLSDTDIMKLPDSFSNLASLTVLLLGWCAKVHHVPSLARLTALKKLDLSYTGLEGLPEGMDVLKNLRYLNLDGSVVSDLPEGILPKLSKLQFLKLHQKFGVILTVRGEEVSQLGKLETLECNFCGFKDFNLYTTKVGQRLPLTAYNLIIGRPRHPSVFADLHYTSSELTKMVWLYGLPLCNQNIWMIPECIKTLVIVHCYAVTSAESANLLLACLGLFCYFSLHRLGSLEILYLDGLANVEALVTTGPPPSLPGVDICYCLKEIVVHRCSSMKVLFPRWLFSGLFFLEVIVVENCYEMEEIVRTEEESGGNRIAGSCFIMRLRVLVLKDLPKLNSFYSGELSCSSLEEITVNDCPNLKRMSFNLPPSLKKIEVHPESWWESVKWSSCVMDDPVLQEDAIAQLETDLSGELP